MRVVSVTFNSPVKVAYERLTVPAPHWIAAPGVVIPDALGSRRPAVFVRGTPAAATLSLSIQGSPNTGENTVVRGILGGLELRGRVPLRDGPHQVDLEIRGIGNALARHVGNVTWRLEPSNAQPIVLGGTTLLEVFVILGDPLAVFQTKGVWTEALRLLLLSAGLQGVAQPREAVTRITSFFHSSHNLRYDTLGGESAYGVRDVGGVFKLSRFLVHFAPQVSCFDMLAAVHVLAGAIGVPTLWLTHASFGFIMTTDLVGVRNCNNPFFSKNNTPPFLENRRDERRTPFGPHAFCEMEQEIFDACVGPRLGGAGRQAFLNAAADPVNHRNLPVPSAGAISALNSPIKKLT